MRDVAGATADGASPAAAVPALLTVEIPGEGYHRGLISCQAACPVHTDARGYVRAIAEGRFEEAYLIARGPNPFASICGRVCGAPCEAACRRGKVPRVDDDGTFVANDRPISIRALKRFVCSLAGPESRMPTAVLDAIRRFVPEVCSDADEMAALLRGAIDGCIPRAAGQKVAIIGAGPAGLSAAHDLALLGFKPVVYESEPVAAGMLAVGVPAYRLPRELIRREVAVIEALGVEIRCGVTVGKDVSFEELRRTHAAVLIAVGAKRSRALGLRGENGPGVLGGVDLLRSVSLGEPLALGRDVVVVGGGNVAYDVARSVVRQIAWDAARTAARLPGTGRVRLVSLEELEEMPADTVEIREGDEEGVERLNGWGPVAIERDAAGAVTGVTFRRCVRVYDENRRFSPVYDDAVRQTLEADSVLLSVGQAPNLSFLAEGGVDVEEMRPGWPKVDPATLATTAPGVFVAGDLAHGTRLLIDAVASGKAAARSIYQTLTGHALTSDTLTAFLTLPGYRRERGYESIRRVSVPVAEPEERLKHPEAEVETGYTAEQAMREASRCLDCGVTPVFDGSRCVLCGGCVDVCPTLCLKLVDLADLAPSADLASAIARDLGPDLGDATAILKDEDRCIRCALCAMRCPTDAIAMDRVTFATTWRTA
ncbi:MAG: FAD-dependent oxidoreductase [Thermoanaerobaculia bacterium]|nr:FAD-dependent oxidoreductase [Thermoanaerobaculia bacterium]